MGAVGSQTSRGFCRILPVAVLQNLPVVPGFVPFSGMLAVVAENSVLSRWDKSARFPDKVWSYLRVVLVFPVAHHPFTIFVGGSCCMPGARRFKLVGTHSASELPPGLSRCGCDLILQLDSPIQGRIRQTAQYILQLDGLVLGEGGCGCAPKE
jgi:hypothetical protein